MQKVYKIESPETSCCIDIKESTTTGHQQALQVLVLQVGSRQRGCLVLVKETQIDLT